MSLTFYFSLKVYVLNPKQDLHGLGFDPYKHAPEFRGTYLKVDKVTVYSFWSCNATVSKLLFFFGFFVLNFYDTFRKEKITHVWEKGAWK